MARCVALLTAVPLISGLDVPSCAHVGRGFNDPNMNMTLNGAYRTSPTSCQEACQETAWCAYWTWYDDSRGCWRQGDGSVLSIINENAYSGPVRCISKETKTSIHTTPAAVLNETTGQGFPWSTWFFIGTALITICAVCICCRKKEDEKEEKGGRRTEEKALDVESQEHPRQQESKVARIDSKSPHVSKGPHLFGRTGLCFSRPKTVDPAWAAISVKQLKELRNQAREKLGTAYGSANMHDVNREVIQPMCDSHGRCYAHIVNSSELLKIDVFISHAWLENFDEFVESILTAFGTWTIQPNIWICATALIQSTDPSVVALQVGASNDPSGAPFTRALAEAQKVLIVRNNVCDIYERIWCCWELYCASVQGHTNRPGALMVVGPAEKSSSDKEVDVGLARASCSEDKRQILAKICQTAAGYEHINRVLTQVRRFGGDADMQQD